MEHLADARRRIDCPVSKKRNWSSGDLADSDPFANDDLRRDCSRRDPDLVARGQIGFMQRFVDSERLAELAGTRAELSRIDSLAAALHERDAVDGFDGAHQHRADSAGRVRDNVEHPVDSIRPVDVDRAWNAMHHILTAFRPGGVRCLIRGIKIRLGLDDPPGGATVCRASPEHA